VPLIQYRRRASEWEYGTICLDCGGPKAANATRCQSCWTETLRGDAYWAARTCPDCGGSMTRRVQRCRPCANERLRGVPRSTPVEPPLDHIWRRKRFGKAAA
jgi:predicted amidophosphoribosyltransferase